MDYAQISWWWAHSRCHLRKNGVSKCIIIALWSFAILTESILSTYEHYMIHGWLYSTTGSFVLAVLEFQPHIADIFTKSSLLPALEVGNVQHVVVITTVMSEHWCGSMVVPCWDYFWWENDLPVLCNCKSYIETVALKGPSLRGPRSPATSFLPKACGWTSWKSPFRGFWVCWNIEHPFHSFLIIFTSSPSDFREARLSNVFWPPNLLHHRVDSFPIPRLHICRFRWNIEVASPSQSCSS